LPARSIDACRVERGRLSPVVGTADEVAVRSRLRLAGLALALGALSLQSPPALGSRAASATAKAATGARAAAVKSPTASAPAVVDKRWASLRRLPDESQHAGGAVLGRRFYVVGGEIRDSPLRLVQAYDAKTGRWVARARLPEARTHVAGVAADSCLFALGGRSPDLVPTRTVFRYNPASNRWGVRKSMPAALSGVAAAEARVGGIDTIFVFGGTNRWGVGTNSTYAYDTAANNWSTMASMPAALSDAAAVRVGGSVYVLGGFDSAEHPSLALFIYDVASNTWTGGASMRANAFGPVGAIAGRDHRIYAVGLDWPARRVDAYDPSSDGWTSAPNLLHPQAYPAMGQIGSWIYAAGGNPGSLTLTSQVLEALRVT
jgi:hypothetical protein